MVEALRLRDVAIPNQMGFCMRLGWNLISSGVDLSGDH